GGGGGGGEGVGGAVRGAGALPAAEPPRRSGRDRPVFGQGRHGPDLREDGRRGRRGRRRAVHGRLGVVRAVGRISNPSSSSLRQRWLGRWGGFTFGEGTDWKWA